MRIKNYMKIEVKSNKLVGILKKRQEIHSEIGEIMKQLVALDKQRTKLGYKMEKLKDKTKAIMDKLNPELKEFEIISSVFEEDGKAYYEVINLVDEYKKTLREKKDV